MKTSMRWAALSVSVGLGLAMGGCSSSDGGSAGTGGASSLGGAGGATDYVITIQNVHFSPDNLDVPPGETVTVRNLDAMLHSVTSEAALDDFTPGAVGGVSFDTGTFASGTRSFSLPATAAAGTVIHYYCEVHDGVMNQPTVTVQ